MKVGDYVRTKYGIKQIYEIDNNKTVWKYKFKLKKQDGDGCIDLGCFSDSDVIKSSPNIIDLIEEHDILKIEEQKGVYTICEVEVFREPYEKYTFLGVRIDNRHVARKLYELNIKSIVTSEQFSQMEYRIGE